MGIIVDLIIVIVLLLFIFGGYKKGLTGSLMKLLSFIIAVVIALLIYKPVANMIIEKTTIDDNIKTTLSSTLRVEEQSEVKDENVSSTIIDNINNEIKDSTNEAKITIIEDTTKTIVNIGAGIIVFLIARLILSIISLFVDAIANLPLIKQVDKVGGIIYGILEGIVIIYILLSIISLTSVVWTNNSIVIAVEKSALGSFLYNNNIILNFLFK